MKKKLFYLASFALLTTALSSCESEYIYSYRESTARHMELMRAGFIKPITADMEVQEEKVEYSVSIKAELSAKDLDAIMQANENGHESAIVLGWKKEALSRTAKHFNADDMVAPLFEITPHPNKDGFIVVKVTGHPAVYKNFRPATKDDIDLVAPFLGHGNIVETSNNTVK